MASNNTLSYRVGQLEKDMEKFTNKLDLLLTNHLPHMQTDISSVKTEVRVLAAINIGAIILFKFLA